MRGVAGGGCVVPLGFIHIGTSCETITIKVRYKMWELRYWVIQITMQSKRQSSVSLKAFGILPWRQLREFYWDVRKAMTRLKTDGKVAAVPDQVENLVGDAQRKNLRKLQ